MLRLVANICNDLVAMRNANAERSKSFLPCETTDLLSEPFRRTGLDLLKHSRNRNPGRFGNQHMNVIWHAANSHGVDSEISRNSSHVFQSSSCLSVGMILPRSFVLKTMCTRTLM